MTGLPTPEARLRGVAAALDAQVAALRLAGEMVLRTLALAAFAALFCPLGGHSTLGRNLFFATMFATTLARVAPQLWVHRAQARVLAALGWPGAAGARSPPAPHQAAAAAAQRVAGRADRILSAAGQACFYVYAFGEIVLDFGSCVTNRGS